MRFPLFQLAVVVAIILFLQVHGAGERTVAADQFKDGKSVLVTNYASPSI